jgi:transposase
MVELGVDQHKRYSQLAALDVKSGVVREGRFDHEAVDEMKAFVASLGSPVRANLETTGNWYWLADMLEDAGAHVQLVNTVEAHRLVKARAKTDRLDALRLATMAAEGILPTVYLPARQQRDERELHRFRIRLIGLQTRVKNIIHSILSKLNVATPFSDMFGKSGRAYLDALVVREPYEGQLRSALRILDGIEPEVVGAKAQIVKALQSNPLAKLIQTAPGIGELTAYLILYEVGPVERFGTHKQFVKYCCLSPGTWQSAEKRRDVPVGRHGNLYLKAALTGAAVAAIRKDGRLANHYKRLCRRKGTSTALVATARKLAISIYYMLSRKQAYQSGSERIARAGKPRLCLGQRS